MKRAEPDALIAELVRANTAALTAVVNQMTELIAVTHALLRQQITAPAAAPPATDAATRKVSVSPELLAEMSGQPVGVPPGVRGPGRRSG